MKLSAAFAGLLFLLFSCTAVRITSAWKDPQLTETNFKRIMVFSLLEGVQNAELRTHMEQHMAADFSQMGYEAKAATDVYGPRSFKGKTEEEIIEQLRLDGFDAVVSLAVLDVAREETYIRERMDYRPEGIYYSRFGRYYSYWYSRVYTPGYYVSSTRYILEANLFDTKTDKLIFSAQTESIDPATLDQLGHRFSMKVVTAMKEKGVLR